MKYEETKKYKYFAEWGGDAPTYEYYRPNWKPEDMTWYQVYETVSEGTPVTPPFKTKEELIDYLVVDGDFWDQERRREGNTTINCSPWPREQAEEFVHSTGWAPSFVFAGGKLMSGVEGLTETNKTK